MDLSFFNFVINIDDKWTELFQSRFHLIFGECIEKNFLTKEEYSQLNNFLFNWIDVCIYNTHTFEHIDKGLYEEYQLKFKFPRYVLNANLTIIK